jgi:hypothetical protein
MKADDRAAVLGEARSIDNPDTLSGTQQQIDESGSLGRDVSAQWHTHAMGRGRGMNPAMRVKKEAEARLLALVPGDEVIVAVGTAAELQTLGRDIGSGAGFTFVVVTSRRLMFSELSSESHSEIRLEEVTQWASGTQYNRYALVLMHPAIRRRRRVAAHRILWFRWSHALTDVTLTQTTFRFSRPETKVAEAIRSALVERAVPHQLLRFDERSREERTGGSHARTYVEKK